MRIRLVLEYDVDSYETLAMAVVAERLSWKCGATEVRDILNMDDTCNPRLRVEAVEDKT